MTPEKYARRGRVQRYPSTVGAASHPFAALDSRVTSVGVVATDAGFKPPTAPLTARVRRLAGTGPQPTTLLTDSRCGAPAIEDKTDRAGPAGEFFSLPPGMTVTGRGGIPVVAFSDDAFLKVP